MPDSIKMDAMKDPNEFNSRYCKSAITILQTYVHLKEDIQHVKYGLIQKRFLLYMDLMQHQLPTQYSA